MFISGTLAVYVRNVYVKNIFVYIKDVQCFCTGPSMFIFKGCSMFIKNLLFIYRTFTVCIRDARCLYNEHFCLYIEHLLFV